MLANSIYYKFFFFQKDAECECTQMPHTTNAAKQLFRY